MRKVLLIWLLTFVCFIQAQTGDFESLNFKKADIVARSLKGEGLDNLPLLAHRLTNKLQTDAERFRAIYYWVCHNIKNDYNLMLKNDRKRRKFRHDSIQLTIWNKTFKNEVIDALITDKRTLCTGYTYLIKELASLAGLKCEIIHGFGKTTNTSLKKIKSPNHSWNAIQLDSKWYLSDATWSSGIIDGDTYIFEFEFNDSYFLMSPEQFAEEHLPLDKKWLLLPSPQPLSASSFE